MYEPKAQKRDKCDSWHHIGIIKAKRVDEIPQGEHVDLEKGEREKGKEGEEEEKLKAWS